MHHVYEAIYNDQGWVGLSDGDANSVWIKGEIKIHKGGHRPPYPALQQSVLVGTAHLIRRYNNLFWWAVPTLRLPVLLPH